MPRKASQNGAPALALVSPLPPAAEPATGVVARKRARRGAAAAEPAAAPAVDLTRPDARAALALAFPTPTPGKIAPSTPDAAAAALAYLEARDAAARAEGAKEAAGNVLRYAIGSAAAEEVAGDGWRATWKLEAGRADMTKVIRMLAGDYKIPQEAIDAAFKACRSAPARVLRVTETATAEPRK